MTVFLAARRPDLAVTWAAVAVNGLLVAGVPLLAGVVARGSTEKPALAATDRNG